MRIIYALILTITLLTGCSKEDIVIPNPQPTQISNEFTGYKVAANAKQMGTEYWENTNVLSDLMIGVFQKNYEVFPLPQGDAYCVWTQSICNGDFNNDGYIDVFNAGAAYNGKKANLSFLIWNSSLLKFEEKNLINDKTSFIGAPTKVSPVYLNGDNYVDLVIHGHADEGKTNSNESVTVCISDGMGGYDLTKLELEPTELLNKLAHEHGDVGDLNGDKLPDLLVVANTNTYIFWGTSSYPYFTNKEYITISSDCAFYSKIKDINTDGYNDILIGTNVKNRILINNGNGTFKDKSIQYSSTLTNAINVFDYIVEDLNKDGLKDIINISATHHKDWAIEVYIQNKNGDFDKDNSWIEYTINLNRANSDYKNRLIYYDFDGDGYKDITYSDSGLYAYTQADNEIKRKSIFLRRGNKFIEASFFEYDKYAKQLKEKYYGL
jgi:hypothetical protein